MEYVNNCISESLDSKDLINQFNTFDSSTTELSNFDKPIGSINDVPKLDKLIPFIVKHHMYETDAFGGTVKKLFKRDSDDLWLGYIEDFHVDPVPSPGEKIDFSYYCVSLWEIENEPSMPRLCLFNEDELFKLNILPFISENELEFSFYKKKGEPNNIAYHYWGEHQ